MTDRTAYFIGPAGVFGPFALADLQKLVDLGLVEEGPPDHFKPTADGHKVVDLLEKADES